MEQEAIHQGGWKAHGADKVEEENRPDAVGVVPGVMGIGVVEEDAFAFFPVAQVTADSQGTVGGRFGDAQGQVHPYHTLVGASVDGDLLVGHENGEEGGVEAGDALNQAGGFGALFAVAIGSHAVSVEEVGLPAIVIGDIILVAGDVLEVGELIDFFEQDIEFLLYQSPLGFDAR